MAARQLQRLRQQQQSGLIEASQVSVEDEESDNQATPSAPPPFNPFDLLTDDDEDDAASPSDVDGDSDTAVPAPAPAPAAAAPAPSASNGGATKSAKARERKKAAKKKKQSAALPAAVKAGEEDIDQLLEQLQMQQRQPAADGGAAALPEARQPLLGVEVRWLKGDDEMRRLFGSKVVDAEDRDDDNSVVGGNRRVRRLAARGLIQRVPLRKGLLVTPRPHWPRFDGGISLELAGATRTGQQLFEYRRSSLYQLVQSSFEECQATFDPNNIAALLQEHPYHVDALLTMFDLYRAMGEHAYADEMLERCLYALEMAWHPAFNPATANTRIDFQHEPNRPLFIALFRHIHNLSRRGLHKTALECCKLLLALDPGDPLGALFYADYLALRAGRHAFLERLAAEWGGDASLPLLPNFAYSLALAKLRQAQAPSTAKQAGSSSPAEEGSRALELAEATEALAQAVLLHPLVVSRLMERLQDKGVGRGLEWRHILGQPLFEQASDCGSASLSHLVDIYVERQHLLWKAQEAQDWLREACKAALSGKSGSADDWAALRAEAFPASDVNRYHHLRVADYSDTVSALPPEELQAAMGAGPAQQQQQQQQGVAIPADQLAIVEAELQALRQRAGVQPGAVLEVSEEELRAMHPLTALLRSLLPWFNAGEQPEYGVEEGQGEPPAAHED